MIVYKKGDLLASEEKVIAHGCNCSGGFGSGFAKQVAELHPSVRQSYINRYNEGQFAMGDIQAVEVDIQGGKIQRTYINCITQLRYGKPDQGPYVSYPAVREVIKKLVAMYPQGFAIPKIGAGLAGGNWDIIEQIINEESGPVEIRVYVL